MSVAAFRTFLFLNIEGFIRDGVGMSDLLVRFDDLLSPERAYFPVLT